MMSIYKNERKTGMVAELPKTGYVMSPAQQAQFASFQRKGWEARKAKESHLGAVGKGIALGAMGSLATYAGYKTLKRVPGPIGKSTQRFGQAGKAFLKKLAPFYKRRGHVRASGIKKFKSLKGGIKS
jgi:hypothetical protein